MTRFNISMKEAVEMVDWVLRKSVGGEIFVPKLSSFNVIDFAKTLCPNCKIKKIGIRPGEKIHEEMITISDSFNTYDLGKYYAIIGANEPKIFKFYSKFKKMKLGSSLNSFDNKMLTKKELNKIIKENLYLINN